MSEPAESPPHRRGVPRILRWLLRVVALVALFVACNSGGVAATTLFPSTADTLNYGASLHLSISPADLSALQSPTVFGTIRVSFAGPVPAPGVLAQVQVKERITELLARPGITVSSLEPGPLELEHAARDAVISLGWRFAARFAVRRPARPRGVCRVAAPAPRPGARRRWSPPCGSPRVWRPSECWR